MKEVYPDFTQRDASEELEKLFVERWSPRSYSSQLVPEKDIQLMVEAARWSPSCYNEQPWHFYISTPTSYSKFLALLVDKNQAWAASAPVLGFVVADKLFSTNNKSNTLAEFDAGSAWMAFSLQAFMLGYQAHGMAGIHYEAAADYLGLEAERQQLICGFALGKVDMTANEELTGRKPLSASWTKID